MLFFQSVFLVLVNMEAGASLESKSLVHAAVFVPLGTSVFFQRHLYGFDLKTSK